VLKTQNVVICLHILRANASQVFRAMEKNFAPTSMNVHVPDRVESTQNVTICLEITRVCVKKGSKEIHSMDALILTSVYILKKLVDRVLFARILKVIKKIKIMHQWTEKGFKQISVSRS
jgi:hypothetical protein